jgi:hypothetical protein
VQGFDFGVQQAGAEGGDFALAVVVAFIGSDELRLEIGDLSVENLFVGFGLGNGAFVLTKLVVGLLNLLGESDSLIIFGPALLFGFQYIGF